VTGITYINRGDGQYGVAAITNNTTEEHTVWLRLNYYDESGVLIAGVTGWAKNIPPGESKQAETMALMRDVTGFARATYEINSIK